MNIRRQKAASAASRPTLRGSGYYFAYGSNMGVRDMGARCPGATLVGAAALDGFEFRINRHGYATVVPMRGKTVFGALWRLTARDWPPLDEYEGVREGLYARARVTVRLLDGGGVKATIYRAANASRGVPRRRYFQEMLQAARDLSLPESYIGELAAWGRIESAKGRGTGLDRTIRHAKPADIGAMVGLLEALFSIEADFSFDPEKQRHGLAHLLQRDDTCLLVCEREGEIIGMCSVQCLVSTAEGGKAGLIEDVVVAAPWRRRGIGSALVAAAEDWATEQGMTRLQLLADESNDPALAFYRSQNWVRTRLVAFRRSLPKR